MKAVAPSEHMSWLQALPQVWSTTFLWIKYPYLNSLGDIHYECFCLSSTGFPCLIYDQKATGPGAVHHLCPEMSVSTLTAESNATLRLNWWPLFPVRGIGRPVSGLSSVWGDNKWTLTRFWPGQIILLPWHQLLCLLSQIPTPLSALHCHHLSLPAFYSPQQADAGGPSWEPMANCVSHAECSINRIPIVYGNKIGDFFFFSVSVKPFLLPILLLFTGTGVLLFTRSRYVAICSNPLCFWLLWICLTSCV